MSFDVAAEAYDAFMGRWSRLLSAPFADLAGVRSGQRALDVGCGTGALTAELVARLGADAVAAADPSAPFVGAMRERFPGVDVREAPAEQLPFADDGFDVTLAQLVVHFMPDPVAGLREMARVTRPGGVVAACVWDHGGQRGPLRDFWAAARTVVPDVDDESELPGTREGHLEELFEAAGLQADRVARRSRSRCRSRRSRRGGSRSPAGSGRRAPSCVASNPTPARRWRPSAVVGSPPTARSRWMALPGRHAASCSVGA